MKKPYKKPSTCSPLATASLLPAAFAAAAAVGKAISPGMALAGGYAIGRAVKSTMEARTDAVRLKALKRVKSYA